MRVAVGKKIRVGHGDEVIVRGRLAHDTKLGRLFVFASENGSEFSPYALNAGAVISTGGLPTMLAPLALRLTEASPERALSFVADIDGYIQVMQEVDGPKDPRAAIKVARKINPNIGWIEWLNRKFLPWPVMRLSS